MKKFMFYFVTFIGLILYNHIFMYTKSACILVHGTWAKGCAWYKPGGDFYDSVQASVQEFKFVDNLIFFEWSGLLGDLAHQHAAHDLAELILQYDQVIIIGHSHGATIGILASKIIGKKDSKRKLFHKIKKFYALGIPVDPTRFIYPDMDVVGDFYNMFSFGDVIQRVHGLYDRVFMEHARITNISVVFKKNDHPSHSQLHHVVIGRHILKIPDWYQQQKVGNFDCYISGQPANINFEYNALPWYSIQLDQKEQLELDKLAFDLAQKAFFRTHKPSDDQ